MHSGRSCGESYEAKQTGLNFCQTDTEWGQVASDPLNFRIALSSNSAQGGQTSESLYVISLIQFKQPITHPILRSDSS